MSDMNDELGIGWTVLWLGGFVVIISIAICLAYTSVRNNEGNVERDRYYAEHCKIVFAANTGTGYQCQNR